MTALPPLSDGRFELLRRLGAGGAGVVYEAFDHKRGGTVALKSLREVDPGSIFRFKNEFRALSDLVHPNLVTLYELVSADEGWILSMELVRGVHFLDHVRPSGGGPTPA